MEIAHPAIVLEEVRVNRQASMVKAMRAYQCAKVPLTDAVIGDIYRSLPSYPIGALKIVLSDGFHNFSAYTPRHIDFNLARFQVGTKVRVAHPSYA
jgi:hypothetical protein